MKQELANYLNAETDKLKAEQRKKRTPRRRFEYLARKRFIKHLDKALEACYEAGMENNGAVLTFNIKDLYQHLTKITKK